MLKIFAILLFSFIVVGCSKRISKCVSDQKAFNKRYLEYLHAEGLEAKKPLLKMLDDIKKSDPKYFDKDHMLALTYARLYVIELVYGNEDDANVYWTKLKKLKRKNHPDLSQKEYDDLVRAYPKGIYKLIRRMDNEKKYPEWEKLRTSL